LRSRPRSGPVSTADVVLGQPVPGALPELLVVPEPHAPSTTGNATTDAARTGAKLMRRRRIQIPSRCPPRVPPQGAPAGAGARAEPAAQRAGHSPVSALMRPCRTTAAAASTRVCAPSERWSRCAISRPQSPSTAHCKTTRSRPVRAASGSSTRDTERTCINKIIRASRVPDNGERKDTPSTERAEPDASGVGTPSGRGSLNRTPSRSGNNQVFQLTLGS